MASFITKSLKSDKDLLALYAFNKKRYPFFLESLSSHPSSRYNLLFAFPLKTILADDDGFLENFKQALPLENNTDCSDLPFLGGWFLFLDYELNQEIEPILHQQKPIKSFATRIPSAIIQDKKTGLTHFVSESDYANNLAIMMDDFNRATIKFKVTKPIDFVEDLPKNYTDGVEKIQKYIMAGDVFQVNLSRVWRGESLDKDYDLYHSLRQKNPASFSGLVSNGDETIISSSPERLVKVTDNAIETRPIAGTFRRSNNNKMDENLAKQLLKNHKERAEHIMLLDMERNDMGRVCQYGSIKVDELMVLESYAFVHHIVSNVVGKRSPNVSAIDIIKAVFPGGTITGCPKVRCMQIIDELEERSRGAYTGSFGYLNHNGNMDLNILIRTLVKSGDNICFSAGGGIVSDSTPEKELQETYEKAKGLML